MPISETESRLIVMESMKEESSMRMSVLSRSSVHVLAHGRCWRWGVVALALCLSLVFAGASWAAVIGPRNASYTPGATSTVPVVIELGSATADRFSFTITVTRNGSAPALTQNLSYQAVDITAANYDTPSIGTLRAMWLFPISSPVTGTVTLGNVLVPIPATASASDSYTVTANPVGASLGGTEVPTTAGPSIVLGGPSGPPIITITITLEQLGVDVSPTDWALGVVEPGAAVTSWASGNEGHFGAANTGNVTEDFSISAAASSPSGWAPNTSAAGTDQFMICFGLGADPYTSQPTWTCFDDTPVSMNGPVPAGEYLPFDLRFTAPTDVTTGTTESFVISLAAAAH